MTDKNLAVCLLARNCASRLEAAFRQMDKLSGQFAAVRIFIVENNSTDGTRALIEAYKRQNPHVTADCFDDTALDTLHRIERLALLRNRALSLVKACADFEPDYLLMVDADVGLSLGRLARILKKAPSDWVSLSANGRYYLRTAGLRLPVLYYDLFAYVPAGSGAVMLSESKMLSSRFALQKQLRRHRFVPCRSAFGGMTVYRYAAVKNNIYTAEKNNGTENFEYLCEHVPFTLRLSPWGKSYICRDMKVLYAPLSREELWIVLKRRFLQLYIKRKTKKILRQRKKYGKTERMSDRKK